MREKVLKMEGTVDDLSRTVKKLCAALEDLREYYFDSLTDETDARYFKYYFDAANTREEIADDYAREISDIAAKIEKQYGEILNFKEVIA